MSIEQQQILTLVLILAMCSRGLIFSKRSFGYAEYFYVVAVASALVCVSRLIINIEPTTTAVLLLSFICFLGFYRTLAEILSEYLPRGYTQYVFMSHVGIWSFLTTWTICW